MTPLCNWCFLPMGEPYLDPRIRPAMCQTCEKRLAVMRRAATYQEEEGRRR